jgi:hypothetical protein
MGNAESRPRAASGSDLTCGSVGWALRFFYGLFNVTVWKSLAEMIG